MQLEPIKLIQRKTGAWWEDERRNWCAYCGRKLEWDQNSSSKQLATRDHVIPRSHGGALTVPSCAPCNIAKGKRSAAEFLTSAYFTQNRGKRPKTEWPLQNLWLVMAMASVELAQRHSPEAARPQPLTDKPAATTKRL